jgi:hypothetical protein
MLSRFDVDVTVFIPNYFNILLFGASQLPVACILCTVSSFFVFFRDFSACSVVKFYMSSSLHRAFISRGFIAVFPLLGLFSVHFAAFSGSIHALFKAPCPVRTFLHFVPIGRLHRLRLFALICRSLVYGLLVVPRSPVMKTVQSKFKLVILFINISFVDPD